MLKQLIYPLLALAAMPAAAQDTVSIADIFAETDTIATQTEELVTAPLPTILLLPAIYMPYDRTVSAPSLTITKGQAPWLDAAIAAQTYGDYLRQNHAVNHPTDVRLNLYTLPEPPKVYVLTADPETATYVFTEVPTLSVEPIEVAAREIRKQHWLNKFSSNIQFSQAFISPNWYQGGNSSLNMIADFTYQSNLNTKFHPKLLFENFFQWRTALQTVDEDQTGRGYSLTENRFQINSKFGYKAAHSWYYTITALLKTPIFNGYKKGEEVRTASFMSPGEFNIGAGMTYNFENEKKSFKLGLTLSPISYNLKTCIDTHIDERSFGIEQGKRTFSTYGSSAEITWTWKMSHNISYTSRIFAFTNYKYFQGDWQNQFDFSINRFLSAKLNVDLRYDTSVEPAPDAKWKKFQLREILSLGFTYVINH